MSPTYPLRRRRQNQAFTLVELLTVMAIMVVLGGLGASFVKGIVNRDGMNSSLQKLSGELERARQYAIAKNTHVWALISEQVDGQDMSIVVIASKEGIDSLGWSSSALDLDANLQNYEILDRVRYLKGVTVLDNDTGDNAQVTLPSLPATTSGEVGDLAAINVSLKSDQTSTIRFDRAIQFTPTGEARSSTSLSRYIDLAVTPSRAQADPNQAVLRIAGLTGKATVYRR